MTDRPLPYDRPTDGAKRHSHALTDGPDRAPARAMLKAIGSTDDDLARPLVGVATTWIRARHGYPLDSRRHGRRGAGGAEDIETLKSSLAARDATIAKLEERVREGQPHALRRAGDDRPRAVLLGERGHER